MLGRFREHIRHNVVGYLALFVALGGTAYAGATIGSDDVINDSLRSVDLMDDAGVRTQDVVDDTDASGGLTRDDLRPDSVGRSEVAQNSLTGSEIQEGTLGLVPEARLGGIGRTTPFFPCNPEASFFVTCDFDTHRFPGARVLILGQVGVRAESNASRGFGFCRIATSTGQVPSEVPVIGKPDHIEHVTLAGVTAGAGPDPVDYGIECNETSGGIRYDDMSISVVALSGE